MACPYCGTHLLHKREGQLHCCGCGRPRQDLAGSLHLSSLLRHTPILLSVLLVVPLALGMSTLDAKRSSPEPEPPRTEVAQHQRQ